MFISVDLPAPFSPRSVCTSPRRSWKSTWSLATIPGKRFVIPRSSRTGTSLILDILRPCGGRRGRPPAPPPPRPPPYPRGGGGGPAPPAPLRGRLFLPAPPCPGPPAGPSPPPPP